MGSVTSESMFWNVEVGVQFCNGGPAIHTDGYLEKTYISVITIIYETYSMHMYSKQ